MIIKSTCSNRALKNDESSARLVGHSTVTPSQSAIQHSSINIESTYCQAYSHHVQGLPTLNTFKLKMDGLIVITLINLSAPWWFGTQLMMGHGAQHGGTATPAQICNET